MRNKNVFITGMMRSGTTLLAHLLTSHPMICVLPQPAPLLFVDIKKRFYKKIGHPEQYNVLGHMFGEDRYQQKDLDRFLKTETISKKNIVRVFEEMCQYSGKLSAFCDEEILRIQYSGRMLDGVLRHFLSHEKKKVRGIKEVLCEEFIPFLCQKNFKCILIVRDPRDIIHSLNYPQRVVSVSGGEKIRPTLWNLRLWRKSVLYALYLANNENFMLVKYEDLVVCPEQELKKILAFLCVNDLSQEMLQGEITDAHGVTWLGNSSEHDLYYVSAKRIGVFKSLPPDLVRYIESICYEEMRFLSYSFQELNKDADINTIRSFVEPKPVTHPSFPSDYSSSQANIDFEVHRTKRLSALDRNMKKISCEWFFK
jgi:hypothetical protein